MTRRHDQSLVARQLAALANAGWSVADAVTMLAADTPAGPAKALLQRYAEALRTSEEPPNAESDPIMVLIRSGKAATPAGFDKAARAFEQELEAEAATSALWRYLGVVLLVAFSFACLLAFGVAPAFLSLFSALGADLPLPTRLLFAVLQGFRWTSPLIVGALIWFWWQRPWLDRLAGLPRLRHAARMRHIAALPHEAASLGSTPLALPALDPHEAALWRWLLPELGHAGAATVLADELELTARRAWRAAAVLGPLLVLLAAILLGGAIIAGLFLPVFAVAGGVR
jgi:type II secretory pathway component PulF